MKKWIGLMLMVVMVFSFAGCGKKAEEAATNNTAGETAEATESTEPAKETKEEGAAGGTFVGKGFTIEYPATVEEKTHSFGDQMLVDKAGVFSVIPKTTDDNGNYEETVKAWSEGQKDFEGFSKSDVKIGGKDGVRITYIIESEGPTILYLAPIDDKKTLFMAFVPEELSGKMEDLEKAPEIQQIIDGVKFEQ